MRLRNMVGYALPSDVKRPEALARLLHVQLEPQFRGAYKDIPEQTVPAHIKWSNNPVFAYAGIVEGEVQYRYGEEGGSDFCLCPVTTKPSDIARIAALFECHYHYLGLPQAIEQEREHLRIQAEKVAKAQAIDRSDKVALIAQYLESGEEEFFSLVLDGDNDDIVCSALWLEEDQEMITLCEGILNTGSLSCEFNDSDDPAGCELIIIYKGVRTKVNYPQEADKDITLITLNEVLRPDYEVRLCKIYDGSDMATLLPLATAQWASLEARFGQAKLAEYFAKIEQGSKVFN